MPLPIFIDVLEEDIDIKIKQFFIEYNLFYARYRGVVNGTYADIKYHMSDLAVHMDFETDEIFDKIETAGIPDNKKALVVFKTVKRKSDVAFPFDGDCIAEFIIVVEAKGQGRLNINGYTQLLQAILNPETRKMEWLKYGLVPRKLFFGAVRNGKELAPKLENRFLIRNLAVTFDSRS